MVQLKKLESRIATMFADIQAQLKCITQTLDKSQERLIKLETPLENSNEHEGKRGPLTPYQNDRYLTSTHLDVPIFYGRLDYFSSDPHNFFRLATKYGQVLHRYPLFKTEKSQVRYYKTDWTS